MQQQIKNVKPICTKDGLFVIVVPFGPTTI